MNFLLYPFSDTKLTQTLDFYLGTQSLGRLDTTEFNFECEETIAFTTNGNRKTSVKANTAIARELASSCWSLVAPLQQGEHVNGD